MKDSKISVIIPVYNPGRHLAKCLDSIVKQSHSNLEIILVDDGSTDGSSRICDEYAQKDTRIVVIHQQNSGVSKARNVGLNYATGDFVNFPDSDDYIELDTFEYALQQMEFHHANAACFEYYISYPGKEIAHIASDKKYGVLDTKGSIEELLFSNRSFLCTKLLPIEAVKHIRFFEDIYRDEDTLFCMFALQNIEKTAFLERPLYHYVQSEESACRGVFRPNQLSAVKAIPIMENFLNDYYPEFINRWRCNYMSLMIMLYCDMYLDAKEYSAEQKMIYNVFKDLRSKIKNNKSLSKKVYFKFALFNFSPKLFCFVHKVINKL